mmetsp:Transcript_6657/g.14379  ORF Transcript_6657/g.14379 Transcript_6657/m.14379 type:complete len:529 (+) Transcript_6657:53-1639(+)
MSAPPPTTAAAKGQAKPAAKAVLPGAAFPGKGADSLHVARIKGRIQDLEKEGDPGAAVLSSLLAKFDAATKALELIGSEVRMTAESLPRGSVSELIAKTSSAWHGGLQDPDFSPMSEQRQRVHSVQAFDLAVETKVSPEDTTTASENPKAAPVARMRSKKGRKDARNFLSDSLTEEQEAWMKKSWKAYRERLGQLQGVDRHSRADFEHDEPRSPMGRVRSGPLSYKATPFSTDDHKSAPQDPAPAAESAGKAGAKKRPAGLMLRPPKTIEQPQAVSEMAIAAGVSSTENASAGAGARASRSSARGKTVEEIAAEAVAAVAAEKARAEAEARAAAEGGEVDIKAARIILAIETSQKQRFSDGTLVLFRGEGVLPSESTYFVKRMPDESIVLFEDLQLTRGLDMGSLTLSGTLQSATPVSPAGSQRSNNRSTTTPAGPGSPVLGARRAERAVSLADRRLGERKPTLQGIQSNERAPFEESEPMSPHSPGAFNPWKNNSRRKSRGKPAVDSSGFLMLQKSCKATISEQDEL